MSLHALARLLGIKPHQAEGALHSERAARAVLSRRDLFAAGSALAVGSAFSFARPWRDLSPFIVAMLDAQAEVIVGTARQLSWVCNVPFHIMNGEPEAALRDRVRRQLRTATLEILNR